MGTLFLALPVGVFKMTHTALPDARLPVPDETAAGALWGALPTESQDALEAGGIPRRAFEATAIDLFRAAEAAHQEAIDPNEFDELLVRRLKEEAS